MSGTIVTSPYKSRLLDLLCNHAIMRSNRPSWTDSRHGHPRYAAAKIYVAQFAEQQAPVTLLAFGFAYFFNLCTKRHEMKLESALQLKSSLTRSNLTASVAQPPRAMMLAAAAARAEAPQTLTRKPPLAIGISGKGNDYRLAVRVQKVESGLQTVLDDIRKRCNGEMVVRHVGTVLKQTPWHQRRNRPLRIGGSIGHVDVTAGTLGCFVTPRNGGGEFNWILSNNHVLANENRSRIGDPIIQPGDIDAGQRTRDSVGNLAKSVNLKRRNNRIDAAAASINHGIEYYYNWLETLGAITGVRTSPLDEGETVKKVGRTTGVTTGRVSAIEVDSLEVEYDMGNIVFNGQVEISPASAGRPFSLGGDSGSLIIDSRRRAVALLFAGNDIDATFANPIGDVLEALKVDLLF